MSAFQQDVAAATQALDTYRAATRTTYTAGDCTAAVNGYGAPMQRDLDHMMSHSSSTNDHMRSMGQPSRADVGCGVPRSHDGWRHGAYAPSARAAPARLTTSPTEMVGTVATSALFELLVYSLWRGRSLAPGEAGAV